MKKNVFLVSIALLCSSMMLFADGAKDIQYSLGKPRIDSFDTDNDGTYDKFQLHRDANGNIEYDTFGKCDEQYFSAIQLTITRPEAVKFSVSAGKKVEFAKGNLQYSAAQKAFRFAGNQWEVVGFGGKTASDTVVYWDSLYHAIDPNDPAGKKWLWVDSTLGNKGDSCYDFDTIRAVSDNALVSRTYGGWIDLFGWGTSGIESERVFGKKDVQCHATYPFSSNNVNYDGTSHPQNLTGYGPTNDAAVNIGGVGPLSGEVVGFAAAYGLCKYYDWGRYNDIYCKWVGYDTITDKTTGLLKDTMIYDSTMFHATVISASTGLKDSFVNLWRTLTKAEWDYLFANNRGAFCPWTNAEITVSGTGKKVKGTLIFPDDYTMEKAKTRLAGAYTGADLAQKSTAYQAVSYANWKALEATGVVFLPAAGRRDFRTFDQLGANGHYWSATGITNANAAAADFSGTAAPTTSSVKRQFGYSVRLVHDVEEDENGKSTSIFFKTVHDLSQHNSIYQRKHP